MLFRSNLAEPFAKGPGDTRRLALGARAPLSLAGLARCPSLRLVEVPGRRHKRLEAVQVRFQLRGQLPSAGAG